MGTFGEITLDKKISRYCLFKETVALWATAADLAMRYGPLRRIWLTAMGHCSGFGYALWATAGNEAVH